MARYHVHIELDKWIEAKDEHEAISLTMEELDEDYFDVNKCKN